jgi:hypothetical protein
VIWGGDETVRALRSLPLPPRAIELTFPDRLSYMALAGERVLALGDAELRALAEQLFNDAYWFDQSACSSPRALLCCGPRAAALEAARRLLSALARVIEHRGQRAAPATVLAKRLYAERLAIDAGATGLEWFSSELVALEVPSLDALRQREHCGGGLFLLLQLRQLGELAEQVTSRDQTLTHFGFESAELQELAQSVQGRGLDRIVPVGKALELSHVWDGYDLLESFTRARDLRLTSQNV